MLLLLDVQHPKLTTAFILILIIFDCGFQFKLETACLTLTTHITCDQDGFGVK